MSINLGRRGPDGRTGWELRHGRPFGRTLPGFGEVVHFLPGGKRSSGLTDKFSTGVYLGPTLRSDELLVATQLGVVRARTVKRPPELQRRNKELFDGVVGTP